MSALSATTLNLPPTLRTTVTYLADEREARPVGVRVVEPPADTRQAVRGNLYAVVELAHDLPDRETLAERLLSVMQRTYYTVKGSQSLVLTSALQAGEEALKQFAAVHAIPQPPAGMVVAALLGNRLLAISNAAGLALVTAGRNIDVYPPYTVASSTPQPANSSGQWEIYRQELPAGGAFFLGTRTWLDQVSLRELAGTVAYLTADNCDEIAAALCSQRGANELPGLLIQAAPTAASTALTPPRRTRLTGLPTALNALPPVHDLGATDLAGSGQPLSTVDYASPPPAAAQSALPTTPGVASTAGNLAADLAAGAKTGLQRARDLLAGLLPDRNPAESPLRYPPLAAEPAYATATEAALPVYHPGEKPTAGRTLPPIALPARTTGRRARLFILVAVLVLFLVPAVVGVRILSNGLNNDANANMLLDQAAARLASATEALDADDKANARDLLYQAQGLVNNARGLLVGRSARADTLTVEIQRALAEVLQIQPLYGLVEPLVRFPADAQPHRLLVVDQDIYVLDLGRQLVQRFQIDLNTNTVPDQAGEIVIRQGDTIEQKSVGRLVDIAWQPPVPGVEDKPKLLILDRNNQMFGYDQRVEGITAVPFTDQSAWRNVTQIHTYRGRLYLVDEGAGQIFRYTAGNYTVAPEPWFSAQSQINLSGVNAVAIDGDIWLLYTNGLILRYQRGEQVPFSLDKSVPLAGEAVDIAVGDQGDSLIYLADRAQERILVFEKNGKYLRQLQAVEGNPLRNLSALFVDEVGSKIYILTQSSLYVHALPNQ